MRTTSAESTLVIAVPYDAQLFNDIYRNYTGTGGYFVCNNVFNRLVVLDVLDSKGAYPDLAETWQVSPDARFYTFYLRRGVRWHDGRPFTSEDVKYTYDTVIANRHSGAPWLAGIREIRTPDPHVLEIVLGEPNSAFLAQLGIFIMTMILPRHLYEGTDWENNLRNWEPVGTGPFCFDRWDKGREIHMVANPDYFGGRPVVDRVILRVIPDREDAFDAVMRGDVHFAVHSPPCGRVREFLANPDLGVLTRPGHSLAYLGFNMRRSPWNDRRLRTAVAQTIDRDAIHAAICPFAYRADGAYLPSHPWAFDPPARMPARDMAAAAAVLKQAGLAGPDAADAPHAPHAADPADAAKPRRASSPGTGRFKMVYQAVFEYVGQLAEEVARQLGEAGIEVRVEGLDSVAWRSVVTERHDFDLMIGTGDIGPDPQLFASFLTSGSPRNDLGYSNPEADRLFALGRSVFDTEKRKEHYHALQHLLSADLPRITLMQHGTHSPYSRRFVGWAWDLGVRGLSPFYGFSHVRPAGRSSATGVETGT